MAILRPQPDDGFHARFQPFYYASNSRSARSGEREVDGRVVACVQLDLRRGSTSAGVRVKGRDVGKLGGGVGWVGRILLCLNQALKAREESSDNVILAGEQATDAIFSKIVRLRQS